MANTKLFFDTEFTGLHQNTTLISIGIISEGGKIFYAEFDDYNRTQVDSWILNNVIKSLKYKSPKKGEQKFYISSRHESNKIGNNIFEGYSVEMQGNKEEVKKSLLKWFSQFDSIEMWSDCLAYDWVLFNNLFGTAFDIPKNIYYIPFDICTLFKMNNIDPDISREKFCGIKKVTEKHNALWDAKLIKECYYKLVKE